MDKKGHIRSEYQLLPDKTLVPSPPKKTLDSPEPTKASPKVEVTEEEVITGDKPEEYITTAQYHYRSNGQAVRFVEGFTGVLRDQENLANHNFTWNTLQQYFPLLARTFPSTPNQYLEVSLRKQETKCRRENKRRDS